MRRCQRLDKLQRAKRAYRKKEEKMSEDVTSLTSAKSHQRGCGTHEGMHSVSTENTVKISLQCVCVVRVSFSKGSLPFQWTVTAECEGNSTTSRKGFKPCSVIY